MPTAANNREPLLALEHVFVSFGGLRALADVSFCVHPGEIVGLIGPNGAGKTTAFNLITGFLPPSGGRIVYRGIELKGRPPQAIAALGLVRTFQRTSLFPQSTVLENALIGLHRQSGARLWHALLALPGDSSQRHLVAQAWGILQLVGLEARAQDLAASLPYGEQRLVGVAVALAAQPAMLLLDEPVSGMNPSETVRFMALIQRIRAHGVTILLVEHDMRMVMGLSDRVVVLNHGQVIAEGPPASVQRDPAVMRAYLGRGSAGAAPT